MKTYPKSQRLAATALALAIACALPGHALARDYTVQTAQELVDAINDANTFGDPTAKITLLNNITLTGVLPGTTIGATLPSPGIPVTIDTQGFSLTGTGASGGGIILAGTGATLTIMGTLTGGDGVGNGVGGNGGIGLGVNQQAPAATSIVNLGNIVGGSTSSGGATGGTGASQGKGTFLNHGTITGGFGMAAAQGGTGANINGTGTLTNEGTIAGGASQAGLGGTGVFMAVGGSTLINDAMVRGGESIGGATGGVGVRTSGAGAYVVENAATGTIQGGAGKNAILVGATSTIINSGTISAGAGQSDAIVATRPLILELRSGSSIDGNVVGATTTFTSTLRLGGAGDASFDASDIGDTAQYQNFDFFQKVGTGKWTLTGSGTAVTPWDIQQGTLAIGSDAGLGDASGLLTFNGGTLETTADIATSRNVLLNGAGTFLTDAGTTLALNGPVSGSGGLIKDGDGTLVLGNAYTYSGPTTVEAGRLQIDGSVTSPVTVGAAGTLGGVGTITGDLTNAGKVGPGNSIGTLTVAGNYVGQGGTLEIEAALNGDDSAADRLVVTGDSSGSTHMKVVNVGGAGAQTVEGIKVVDVHGASNGSFDLVGDYVYQGQQAVVAGPYAYRLYKGGTSTPNDGGWYLRSVDITPAGGEEPPGGGTEPPAGGEAPPTGSGTPPVESGTPPPPLFAPNAPVYEAYAGVLQQLNTLGTLQQRVGSRDWTVTDGDRYGAAWVRVDGGHTDLSPGTTTTDTHYDASTQKAQAGVDFVLRDANAGVLVAGVTLQYGRVDSNVSSTYGLGRIKSKGHGLGGTLTWYGENGFYADAQAQWNRYDSDLTSRTLGRELVDSNDGTGYNAGVEVGQKLKLGDAWSLIPQVQLTYSTVRFDRFDDPYGAVVHRKDSDSLVSRAGMAADYSTSWRADSGTMTRAHLYGIANVYYDFRDGTATDVSGAYLASKDASLWGGLGAGGSLDWKDGRYKIYGEATAQTSLHHYGDSKSVGVKLGFDMKW